VTIDIDNYRIDFGQLIFQSKRKALDFTEKYNKLFLPLILVGVAVLFLNDGIIEWFARNTAFYEFVASPEELGIPAIALWIFLGVSIVYLIFCISRLSNFEGYQVGVYERGAVLELIGKTIEFHFDELIRANVEEVREYKKPKEMHAFIYLRGKTLPIDISEQDVAEVEMFVKQLSTAYNNYIAKKNDTKGWL